MSDHDGVLMMQRLLLAGTLGLAVARKAAAILDGEPTAADPRVPMPMPVPVPEALPGPGGTGGQPFSDPRTLNGAVLRAIVDAANECLGHFDDRPPAERWCDALLHLLDLAAFADGLASADGLGSVG